MSHELAAREAYHYARNEIRFKSYNKIVDKKEQENEDYRNRWKQSYDRREAFESWAGALTGRATLAGYAQKISEIGAGNCMEYAIVALHYMRSNGHANATNSGYVSFEGIDHAFAQIGFAVPGNGKYPTDFRSWGNAWIVDPWASIVCPAIVYHQKFEEKLQSWEKKGKQVIAEYGCFGSPLFMIPHINVAEKTHRSVFD